MKNTFKKRNIAVRIFVSVVMVCSIFMGVGLPKDANASCDLMILDGYDCDNIDGIGQDVVSVLRGIVMSAATVGIIICGVMWATAGDNEGRVGTAKKRLFEIAIGVAIWVLFEVVNGALFGNQLIGN
jgi:hypothetical protein